MYNTYKTDDFVPKNVPEKIMGTLKCKIWQKTDRTKKDGTCSLYLQFYQRINKITTRKRINLNLAVPINCFDSKTQRVKSNFKFSKDYNLIIEKKLSDINTIEINYRLNGEDLTIEKMLRDLTNPGLRVSFYKFWDNLMQYQYDKSIIQYETFKQQRATLRKLKMFKATLLFKDIDENYLLELRAWLKTTLKQAPATIEIVFKNFKKYLKAANEKGIKTAVTAGKISVKKTQSNFTFLTPKEVKTLHELYKKETISDLWKNILQRYLFSCFTGLRISDIKNLKKDNFIDGTLVFVSHKSKKLQRIKLNNTAKSLIDLPLVFNGKVSDNTINKELKLIAHACDINKRVYFHSSRHTFATNYLIAGGKIRNLQKLLGHSKLETTELYAHVVDSIMNEEIGYLDDIIN